MQRRGPSNSPGQAMPLSERRSFFGLSAPGKAKPGEVSQTGPSGVTFGVSAAAGSASRIARQAYRAARIPGVPPLVGRRLGGRDPPSSRSAIAASRAGLYGDTCIFLLSRSPRAARRARRRSVIDPRGKKIGGTIRMTGCRVNDGNAEIAAIPRWRGDGSNRAKATLRANDFREEDGL